MPHANDDSARQAAWRKHLDHGLSQPGQTVVLADMDATGNMAMQTRCDRPRDLLDIARALIQQARDTLAEMDGAEAEGPQEIAEDALAILPDPHDREDAA